MRKATRKEALVSILKIYTEAFERNFKGFKNFYLIPVSELKDIDIQKASSNAFNSELEKFRKYLGQQLGKDIDNYHTPFFHIDNYVILGIKRKF